MIATRKAKVVYAVLLALVGGSLSHWHFRGMNFGGQENSLGKSSKGQAKDPLLVVLA